MMNPTGESESDAVRLDFDRRLVAIRRAHALRALPDPVRSELVRLTFRGIRRAHGRPQRRAAALAAEEMAAIVASLGDSVRDARDRALLLIGLVNAERAVFAQGRCSIHWRPPHYRKPGQPAGPPSSQRAPRA